MTLCGNWVFFKIPKYVFISDSTQDDDSCSYSCQNDGGCEVRKDGWLGSCFPPSFGGECDGTPPGCSDCSQKCQGKNGSKITSDSNSRSSYSSFGSHFGRNSGSRYSTSGSNGRSVGAILEAVMGREMVEVGKEEDLQA